MLEDKIKALRQFFTISVAAFEMQHTISRVFCYNGNKSYLHLLHLRAKEEIEKENPDMKLIYSFLVIMENLVKDNKNNLDNL